MSTGAYSNGFIPGETVTIDLPCTSFDGLETEVVSPRPNDILEPEDVLVESPLNHNVVLRLHENCLVKAWGGGFSRSAADLRGVQGSLAAGFMA